MGEHFGAKRRIDKMADADCNDQASEQGSEQAMDMEHPNTATETSTARLMITKIVNENFKSYAGTQELGPFHKVSYVSFHYADYAAYALRVHNTDNISGDACVCDYQRLFSVGWDRSNGNQF